MGEVLRDAEREEMNTTRQEWMRLLTNAVHDATGQGAQSCAKQAGVILDHLAREYGGHRVYVPAISRKPLPVDKIMVLLREGLSFADVARRFNVTERTIRNYVPGGMKRLRKMSTIEGM